MADQTEDSGATGAAAGGTARPFMVFQTQDEFNAHAAKIRHEAERKAKSLSADERATLDAAQAELEQRRLRDEEAKGNYEKAKKAIEDAASSRITQAEARLKKAESVLHEHLVNAQLRALAQAHGAYDPEDVVARLGSHVVVDEDYQVRVRSTDATGAVQDGASLEQAVVELLKTKPHLAKAVGSGRSAGTVGGASMTGTYSGTPSQREAQAKYDEAVKRVQANPRDNVAAADLLRAKAALKQALV